MPDAFRQVDRLHVQGTMPAAGKRKCKDLCRFGFSFFFSVKLQHRLPGLQNKNLVVQVFPCSASFFSGSTKVKIFMCQKIYIYNAGFKNLIKPLSSVFYLLHFF